MVTREKITLLVGRLRANRKDGRGEGMRGEIRGKRAPGGSSFYELSPSRIAFPRRSSYIHLVRRQYDPPSDKTHPPSSRRAMAGRHRVLAPSRLVTSGTHTFQERNTHVALSLRMPFDTRSLTRRGTFRGCNFSKKKTIFGSYHIEKSELRQSVKVKNRDT